jgi:hypothetical protein
MMVWFLIKVCSVCLLLSTYSDVYEFFFCSYNGEVEKVSFKLFVACFSVIVLLTFS